MNAHEILIAAKALIPDEEHWWRGDSDPNGRSCSEAARYGCYCLISAIDALEIGSRLGLLLDCFDALRMQITTPGETIEPSAIAIESSVEAIESWNDAPERTLAEVHAALDRAIEATKP